MVSKCAETLHCASPHAVFTDHTSDHATNASSRANVRTFISEILYLFPKAKRRSQVEKRLKNTKKRRVRLQAFVVRSDMYSVRVQGWFKTTGRTLHGYTYVRGMHARTKLSMLKVDELV
ncbi:hypothetical protein CBL_12428 [Carabus blaptoides fortunei]